MSNHRRSGIPARLAAAFFGLGPLKASRRDHVAALALTIGLVAASVIGLFGLFDGSSHSSALPPTPQAPAVSSSAAPTAARSEGAAHAAAKPFTCPVPGGGSTGSGDAPDSLCIPSLHVATSVMLLGLNSDHTVQVPPLSKVRDAGWYRYSAPPGQVGPTVILGHVDSAQYGEGVFFQLGKLKGGDQVRIQRGDGKTAVYRIDRVQEVSKKSFPTDEVYGATSGPALRLVTCGGKFDSSTGNYLDNIIAFGTLLTLQNA